MREYRVWKKEEEQALRLGVAKHGPGNWEHIRTDPEFNTTLQARSGVQLKDKWRNLVKFHHLTAEELNCGAGGGVKTRTSLRQRTRRNVAEVASEDEEVVAATRKCRNKTAIRPTHTGTGPSREKENELLKVVLHLRNVATNRTEPTCADTDTDLSALGSSTVQVLDHIVHLINIAIRDDTRLSVPAAIVQACPAALRTPLEPFSDSAIYPTSAGMDSNVQEVATNSRVSIEHAPCRHVAAAPCMLGTHAPDIITTGANPRAKDGTSLHSNDGIRDLYACMEYQYAAPSLMEHSAQTHRLADRVGSKRAHAGRDNMAPSNAPPQKKVMHTAGESTGATAACTDIHLTDSTDDGPLISYNPSFEPNTPLMNTAELLMNVTSGASDDGGTKAHPEGADSASFSDAGNCDNADDDFLNKLYKDCFDSKPHAQEACMDAMLQFENNFPLPAFCNISPTFCTIAPTRLSAPQLQMEDVALRNSHESPMSQSTQAPQPIHTSSWVPPASTMPADSSLPSTQHMLHRGAPCGVAVHASSPTKASPHCQSAATGAPYEGETKSDHLPASTSFRESPSSCTVSTAGGNAHFNAPYPWAGACPKPSSLMTATNSNAASSTMVCMQGMTPSGSHSMHRSMSSGSHDALAMSPFRMSSRESSMKAGTDMLPDMRRSFQNSSTSEISPTSEAMPANWCEVASHAVLNSTASALLGFYPSANDMQRVASLTSIPTSMPSTMPASIALQPTLAYSSELENLPTSRAFPSCHRNAAPSISAMPYSSSHADSTQDASADPLAYFAPMAGAGSMMGQYACEKSAGCDVAIGVLPSPESCTALESLMDMEAGTGDLVFDGFKPW